LSGNWTPLRQHPVPQNEGGAAIVPLKFIRDGAT